MNWKNRLTNYNFWISIFSAVLLILQALKIEFDIAYVNEIFTAVLGLLVVIGIINDPTRISVKSTTETKEVAVKEKSKQDATDELKQEEKVNVSGEKLPTNKEDETNYVDTKNDLQVIIAKITADLDEKFQQLNLNTNQNQIQTSISNQSKNEYVQSEEAPAVAENPYFDL